jgi:hypothetical protein
MVSPSVFAVLMLITNSNFVGCARQQAARRERERL